MESPFDRKNKLAALIDRLALRAALFALCTGYFILLWNNLPLGLAAGGSVFILLLLTLALFERSTLERRDRLLRERVGGAIALDELLLMPGENACEAACALLADALNAAPLGGAQMRCEGETWLVRCAQCLPGGAASDGDVLAAHRARTQAGADKCLLASLGGFSPQAIRTAEWMDPPVRLVPGRQLALLAGRLHPATDEEIAQHARRRRIPFSWRRIRALALSPGKLRRHLLCAFLLLLLYFWLDSPIALLSAALSFLLALLCHRENRRRFRL